MTVQVVLGLCCLQMSVEFITVKVVPGPCSQMSDTRLYDCTGCSRALFFTNR